MYDDYDYYNDYNDYYDYYEPPEMYDEPWESYDAGNDAYDSYYEPKYYNIEYEDIKPAGLDLGVVDFIITIIPPLMLVRMLVDVIACLFQRRRIREGRYIQFVTRSDGIDWSSVNGP